MWLVPWNMGIAGGVGVLAFNLIIGGLIGGFVLIVKIVMIGYELLMSFAEVVTGTGGTVTG